MTGIPLPAEPDDRAAKPPAGVPDPLPGSVWDNHTHLDAVGCRTAEDVAAAMDRAAAVGVVGAITVADDLAAAEWAVWAAHADPRVLAAVALHPTRADTLDDHAKQTLTALAADPRVVAIGETGLDYYWEAAPKDIQREAFAWHIDLAKQVGKPLMIHDRQAHEAVFDVLAAEGAPETVVFHCFSGDAAMARICADKGFRVSFAGPVTFAKSYDLHEAATIVPSELLLVETDAPYLTPHPFRGKKNEPYALPWTVRALAELRKTDLEIFCGDVMSATQRTYRLV